MSLDFSVEVPVECALPCCGTCGDYKQAMGLYSTNASTNAFGWTEFAGPIASGSSHATFFANNYDHVGISDGLNTWTAALCFPAYLTQTIIKKNTATSASTFKRVLTRDSRDGIIILHKEYEDSGSGFVEYFSWALNDAGTVTTSGSSAGTYYDAPPFPGETGWTGITLAYEFTATRKYWTFTGTFDGFAYTRLYDVTLSDQVTLADILNEAKRLSEHVDFADESKLYFNFGTNSANWKVKYDATAALETEAACVRFFRGDAGYGDYGELITDSLSIFIPYSPISGPNSADCFMAHSTATSAAAISGGVYTWAVTSGDAYYLRTAFIMIGKVCSEEWEYGLVTDTNQASLSSSTITDPSPTDNGCSELAIPTGGILIPTAEGVVQYLTILCDDSECCV